MNQLLLFFHLVGAAVWLGGMVTMGALVPAMRRSGVERQQIQMVARRFGNVSWVAMAVTVAAGVIAIVIDPVLVSSLPGFELKMGLVILAAGLAIWHQVGARRQTAKIRGIVQGLVLLSTVMVYAIAAGW